MIGRSSTRLIAECYQDKFRRYVDSRTGSLVDKEAIYLFVFERDHEAFFCNLIKGCFRPKDLLSFVLKLHTGESLVPSTDKWTWDKRKNLGQKLLRKLAEDFLNAYFGTRLPAQHYSTDHPDRKEQVSRLRLSLELDGYVYKEKHLSYSERDVLDHQEERGVLDSLYRELKLSAHDLAFHALKLSEEHYVASKWEDSIANSRKFLECVLMQVAAEYGKRITGQPLPENKLGRPFEVRNYLQGEGLVEPKEKEAIASVYGLLSETGSHPNMAAKDQARLLRQLSLTLAQFVMLRFQGKLAAKAI